ncbi:MAG TPA: hypothetical protein VGM56_09320 [Byssovorax sp.]|jgi:hypothetical protein
MKTIALCSTFGAALVATVLGASEARAWGLHAGNTIGAGDNFVYGEAGWPGIGVGFAHGFSDRLEIGGRFDFNYAFESATLDDVDHHPIGVDLAATIRYTLLRGEKVSAELHVLPGLRFDSFSPFVFFGLQFPIGGELGIHLSREATLSLGADVGLFADFTNHGYFAVSPVAGPGFEYHLNEHMTIGAVTRFGVAELAAPAFIRAGGFAFRAQGFFGYRL